MQVRLAAEGQVVGMYPAEVGDERLGVLPPLKTVGLQEETSLALDSSPGSPPKGIEARSTP